MPPLISILIQQKSSSSHCGALGTPTAFQSLPLLHPEQWGWGPWEGNSSHRFWVSADTVLLSSVIPYGSQTSFPNSTSTSLPQNVLPSQSMETPAFPRHSLLFWDPKYFQLVRYHASPHVSPSFNQVLLEAVKYFFLATAHLPGHEVG